MAGIVGNRAVQAAAVGQAFHVRAPGDPRSGELIAEVRLREHVVAVVLTPQV